MSDSNSGLSTFPEISAFLGGLTFAGLLLLLDRGELFSNVQIFTFSINFHPLLIFMLSIETLLFVLCTIFFGFACMRQQFENVDIAVNAGMIFFVTVLGLLVSLLIIFFSINTWIGLVGICVLVIASYYWAYTPIEKRT